MYRTIKKLDQQTREALERIESVVLTCTRQLTDPNQNKTVRKQIVKTAIEQIRDLVEDSRITIMESATVAACLCEGAERIGPEACRARLEIWQTDENVDPKGGD